MPLISMTEAELCRWLSTASPGDKLTYHRGFLAIDIAPGGHRLDERERKELARVARRAMWAVGQNWVHAAQRRHGPNDYTYLLIARPRPQVDWPSVLALLTQDAA